MSKKFRAGLQAHATVSKQVYRALDRSNRTIYAHAECLCYNAYKPMPNILKHAYRKSRPVRKSFALRSFCDRKQVSSALPADFHEEEERDQKKMQYGPLL